MNALGNMNPVPTLVGTRNSIYAQVGISFLINSKPIVPIKQNTPPATRKTFSCFVCVIQKPVRVAKKAPTMEGIMRRSPDSVAVSRRTAWKKSGMLNMTALAKMAHRKFEKMIPARGLCVTMRRGMMGRATRDSVYMKRGKAMLKITRDMITNGCIQG